ELLLDVCGHLVRGQAGGHHIAHERNRDPAIGADGDRDAEFRVAPDGDLDDVVHADGVFGNRGLAWRRRCLQGPAGGTRGQARHHHQRKKLSGHTHSRPPFLIDVSGNAQGQPHRSHGAAPSGRRWVIIGGHAGGSSPCASLSLAVPVTSDATPAWCWPGAGTILSWRTTWATARPACSGACSRSSARPWRSSRWT